MFDIDRLVVEYREKEKVEMFLKGKGITFKEIFRTCNAASTEIKKARRMVFFIGQCSVQISKINYADYEELIYEQIRRYLKRISQRLKIELTKIMKKLAIREKREIQAILKDPDKSFEMADFFKDGGYRGPAFLMHACEVIDLVPEYTHPITAESDARIEELTKINEENLKNGKLLEYDAFGYYLSIIYDYAWYCPDTQQIINYFKWVIAQSKLHEAYFAYSNEPLSPKETTKHEYLRKELQAQIELMEMGRPFGSAVFAPQNSERGKGSSGNFTADFWSYEKIGRDIFRLSGDYKTVVHHMRNIADRHSGLLIPSQLHKRNLFRINKDELKIAWKNEKMPGEIPPLD